ncbi:MAG TPA: hypothetical protein VF824_22350 [Thermoanaerobaculia bacterium]|jgi:hypothetical protein
MPRDAGLTRLRRTVVAIAKQFDAAAIGYMVIGGMAQVVWGEPRATTDVDFTVGVGVEHAQELVRALRGEIKVIPHDLQAYLAGGVFPFTHRTGVHVDLLLSRHPYARLAIE